MKDLKPNVKPSYTVGRLTGEYIPLEKEYHITKEGKVYNLTENKEVISVKKCGLRIVKLEGNELTVIGLIIEAYYDYDYGDVNVEFINDNFEDCRVDNLKIYRIHNNKKVYLKLKEEPKEEPKKEVKMEPNITGYNGLNYPLHVTEDARVYHTKNNHWLNTKGSNKVKVKVGGKLKELSLSWLVVFVHNNNLYNEMINNYRGQTLRHKDGNLNNCNVNNLTLPIKEGVNEMSNLTDMSNEEFEIKLAEMMAEKERRNRKTELETEITELEKCITAKSKKEDELLCSKRKACKKVDEIKDKIANLRRELIKVGDELTNIDTEANKLNSEQRTMINKVHSLKDELKSL